MMTGQAAYAFGNAQQVQRERLRALEDALDAGTIGLLQGCGIAPGWRCLEVGAGGGSIADWMCEQVGRGGRVLATDLDTTVLRARSRPNLDIRVHDVLADDLPSAAFDLVHVRLLLAWLPEPRAVLQRLLRALKPGGRLVAEELDFVSAATAQAPDDASRAVFERVLAAHLDVLRERSGFDSATAPASRRHAQRGRRTTCGAKGACPSGPTATRACASGGSPSCSFAMRCSRPEPPRKTSTARSSSATNPHELPVTLSSWPAGGRAAPASRGR
jgi:SAM-dependent methyltransferase